MVNQQIRQAMPPSASGRERSDMDIEVVRIIMICNIVMSGVMGPTLKDRYGAEEYAEFEKHFAKVCGTMVNNYIKH